MNDNFKQILKSIAVVFTVLMMLLIYGNVETICFFKKDIYTIVTSIGILMIVGALCQINLGLGSTLSVMGAGILLVIFGVGVVVLGWGWTIAVISFILLYLNVFFNFRKNTILIIMVIGITGFAIKDITPPIPPKSLPLPEVLYKDYPEVEWSIVISQYYAYGTSQLLGNFNTNHFTGTKDQAEIFARKCVTELNQTKDGYKYKFNHVEVNHVPKELALKFGDLNMAK